VRASDLAGARAALVEFAEEMYAPLVRCDQRAKGEQYVRGLLLEGRRKSIQPMAARLPDGDEQCLQQFVNQSPWRERVVRANLARRMAVEIDPDAWIVDDTGFVKKGRWSVGVARQYSGTLGRVDSCQVGVSISAATDAASCPINWRIFLPEEWDQDAERRAKAHVPDELRHVEKWRLALEMIDELGDWGLAPRVVCADAGYGEITAFRTGLDEREIDYIVQVKAGTSAYPLDVEPELPAWKGRGRPPVARYRTAPSSLRDLGLAAGERAAAEASWRKGSRGRQRRGRAGGPLAAGRMAGRRRGADRLLALVAAGRHTAARAHSPRQAALAHRARLPRAQRRARPGPLRGPLLPRLAPPRHARLDRARIPHARAPAPENQGGSLTLFELVGELQRLIACWNGTCPTCRRRLPPTSPLRAPP
jgi:SRSO17 transposase